MQIKDTFVETLQRLQDNYHSQLSEKLSKEGVRFEQEKHYKPHGAFSVTIVTDDNSDIALKHYIDGDYMRNLSITKDVLGVKVDLTGRSVMISQVLKLIRDGFANELQAEKNKVGMLVQGTVNEEKKPDVYMCLMNDGNFVRYVNFEELNL